MGSQNTFKNGKMTDSDGAPIELRINKPTTAQKKQPTMHEVVHIPSCSEVSRTNNLPKVKRRRIRSTATVKHVEVFASVIRCNCNEAMNIRCHIGKKKIRNGVTKPPKALSLSPKTPSNC